MYQVIFPITSDFLIMSFGKKKLPSNNFLLWLYLKNCFPALFYVTLAFAVEQPSFHRVLVLLFDTCSRRKLHSKVMSDKRYWSKIHPSIHHIVIVRMSLLISLKSKERGRGWGRKTTPQIILLRKQIHPSTQPTFQRAL